MNNSDLQSSSSLRRALRLLRVLAAGDPAGLRLKDIAEAAGCSQPTAHRMLQDLAAEGFAEQAAGKRYRLALDFYVLAARAGQASGLREAARPALLRLSATLSDTIFLLVRNGFDAVCLDRVEGPFPIRFEPEAALVRDQRKILDMTATSWLSFRELNGLLVYYTHLMSYRCAIREVRIGIDSAVPDKVLSMPGCDMKDPIAIPSNATPYLKLPPATKFVSVELTYRDGSVSEIKSFRR